MEYLLVLESDREFNKQGNRHDKGYKYILSVKRVFIQLLRSFVNQDWVKEIDENKIEKMSGTFIESDFQGKEADILYKVKIGEQDVYFYILMELQSTVDYTMPIRLHSYMHGVWQAILKNTDGETKSHKNYKLPAIIPCVLYNGRYNWTVEISFREKLTGYGLPDDYVLDFKYLLFDVARYNEDELLKLGNLIGAVFYMDQEIRYDKFMEKLKNLVDLLKNLDEEDFLLFKGWLKNLFMRGMSDEETREIEEIIEETDSNKEADTMAFSMGKVLLEKLAEERLKGELEVKLKGELEGKLKGELKGKLITAKNLIEVGMKLEDISNVTEIPIKDLKEALGIK